MEYIRTKDAEEAAFFWTLDDRFEYDNVEVVDYYGRRIVWFKFRTELTESELEQLKNDYLNGKCLVEPRKYAYRRGEIKCLIRERLF